MNITFKILFVFLIATPLFSQNTFFNVWEIESHSCPNVFSNNLRIIDYNSSLYNLIGFQHYDRNGILTDGNCTFVNSTINCGKVSSIYSCNSNSKLFDRIVSFLFIDFDANYPETLPLKMNFTWKNTDGKAFNCIYLGQLSSLKIFNGNWKVKKCDCRACCYDLESKFKFNQNDTYKNQPLAYVSSTLRGDFCQNALIDEDSCYAINTNTEKIGNFTLITSTLNCNYNSNNCGAGIKTVTWGTDTVNNVQTLAVKWEMGIERTTSCSMFADPA